MKRSAVHIKNLLESSAKNYKPITVQLKTGNVVEGYVLFADEHLIVIRRVVGVGEAKSYFNYYIFTEAVELLLETVALPVLEFSPAQVQIELGGVDEE